MNATVTVTKVNLTKSLLKQMRKIECKEFREILKENENAVLGWIYGKVIGLDGTWFVMQAKDEPVLFHCNDQEAKKHTHLFV